MSKGYKSETVNFPHKLELESKLIPFITIPKYNNSSKWYKG